MDFEIRLTDKIGCSDPTGRELMKLKMHKVQWVHKVQRGIEDWWSVWDRVFAIVVCGFQSFSIVIESFVLDAAVAPHPPLQQLSFLLSLGHFLHFIYHMKTIVWYMQLAMRIFFLNSSTNLQLRVF